MALLRYLLCIWVMVAGVGLALFNGLPPTQAEGTLLPPLFDLAHIPPRHSAPAPATLPGWPALMIRHAAPAGGVAYLAVGATVVSPAVRLPLAGSGFMPGATVAITDNGATALTVGVESDGSFAAYLTVPAAPGYHALLARDDSGQTAVAAYTVAAGGASGPLLAVAPAWVGPGAALRAVWAGFIPDGDLLWLRDGVVQGHVPAGSTGSGSFTTTAPATPGAYVYTLRLGEDLPSQTVQVDYPAIAYGSGTTARAPSNVPGAWGAVGEGFTPGERVDLTVNGSPIGSTTANPQGVALAAFAPHPVGDDTLEKLTMTGAISDRRAYSAIYFFRSTPALPGQVQGRWESSTGSTQVVIADNLGFSPAPFQALIDGRTVLSATTSGNGLAVYSYTVPLRDDLAHNLSTRLDSGQTATSRGTILPCPLQFSDVPPGNTFYNYVRWLGCSGHISGYPCGGPGEPCNPNSDPYFRPGNTVTRGQLMKMVVNAAGWPFADPPSPTFADVPAGSTFYAFVETGYSHGLINGYPCGVDPLEPCDGQSRPYFRSGNPITRGQLSKVIALARAYPLGYPPAPTFEDVPITDTFYLYVEALSRSGLLLGYPCGGAGEPCVPPGNRPYFRPGNSATRAQVAKIVTIAYGGP
jgi:hypothetical protein